MIKIKSSSINKKSKIIGTTITFVLAFFVAAFVASGVSYGAKPFSPIALSPTVCNRIGGVWTTNTCTIPAGINGVANQPFTISNGVTLDVQGSLTINMGITVTVANSGRIIVENAGGVSQPNQFDNWETGILVLGTLSNSGTITVKNTPDETSSVHTVGISVWVSATDFNDLNTYAFGTLTNSGTISIQNIGETRGIENLSTMANSASGTITVANSGDSNYCVGIYNRRFGGPIQGALTNAGTITITNSGDNSFGIYSKGFLTNSGVLTVNSLSGVGATGIYNGGSFTQTTTGTYYNNQGYIDNEDPMLSVWGNYNEQGTMINYGTTYVSGTFLTIGYTMINYGTIYSTSTGAMVEYDGSMLNYGIIYNSGTIVGGKNFGTCVDVPPTGSGC